MITYSTIDKSDWLYQPNFVRMRHRNRGVRESYKFNLEISQTVFDLYNLNKKATDARDAVNEYFEKVYDGWDLDDDVDHNGSPAELVGIEELMGRLETLRNRVKRLEA